MLDSIFLIQPSNRVYKQKVSVTPIAHHYEDIGERPYIKYGCPICEALLKSYTPDPDLEDPTFKFIKFSVPKGIPTCPCCGINFKWS